MTRIDPRRHRNIEDYVDTINEDEISIIAPRPTPTLITGNYIHRDSIDSVPERFKMYVRSETVYEGIYVSIYGCFSIEKKVLKVTRSHGSKNVFDQAKRECEFLLELRGKPGILWVYDYEIDEISQNVYLLIERSTCLERYLSENMIDLCEIPDIGVGICDALISCKELGIYHLDVSLANCYYEDGIMRLGDFNSAKRIDEGVRRSLIGTFKYMAPEGYHRYEYNELTDEFSLGILLYMICNGGLAPFRPQYNKDRAFEKRMSGAPIPIPQYVQKYPEYLTGIYNCIKRACNKDPNKRYRSFGEFKDALAAEGYYLNRKKPDIKISGYYGDKERTVIPLRP